jgi:hypothetical protein
LHGHQRQTDAPAGGIAGGPRLTRTGIGGMTVGAQTLPIDPGLREGIDDLAARASQEARGHSSRGDLYKDDVIQADTIETVLQGQNALNFMRLDGGHQRVADGEGGFTFRNGSARTVIGNRQDCSEVVGGMAPLGGKPGVVVIQPANRATDVEGRLDGIKLKMGARYPRPVRHDRSRRDRTEVAPARRILQCQERATQAIHQAQAGRVEGSGRANVSLQDVIGDGDQLRIGFRTQIAFGMGRHLAYFSETRSL